MFVVLGATLVWPQSNKVGSTTAQFLKLGVGSRALGMGGSFVALADDGSATYWNPAGMTAVPEVSFSFHHQDWALDIQKDYVSMIAPMGSSTALGLALSVLHMGERPVTTVHEPDGTGLTYSVMDLAAGFSLARQISDRLAYGMTVKTIQLSAYNEKATGLAFDLGSILKTDFHGLRIGMSLANFGSDLRYEGRDLLAKADVDESLDGNVLSDVNLKTESWPLPLRIQIGLATDLVGPDPAWIPAAGQRLTLALDAVHPNDGPEHVHLGLEWDWRGWIFLRTGYRTQYDQESWSLGGGLSWKLGGSGIWRINYAILPLQIFGQTQQISLDWLLP
ncbi:MAG: hypothetical protein D6762_01120 [Candidatus Neomarinimicrobiota bacterium]|nr:MAG: hypothetical protein D6762_01120 [Candidatus Neomarinimicrobiota bacterium]